ncbi:unnamed protein product [Protopolystoma xenopodis]|uniref:Uncharacterized protein n=1 Tax=Protopolystoma xenopodis TaxID=117903 RepID=A0A3S5AKE3_9PLAT|nr:unnamed protein product [Protopolystoma xenopodis]
MSYNVYFTKIHPFILYSYYFCILSLPNRFSSSYSAFHVPSLFISTVSTDNFAPVAKTISFAEIAPNAACAKPPVLNFDVFAAKLATTLFAYPITAQLKWARGALL